MNSRFCMFFQPGPVGSCVLPSEHRLEEFARGDGAGCEQRLGLLRGCGHAHCIHHPPTQRCQRSAELHESAQTGDGAVSHAEGQHLAQRQVLEGLQALCSRLLGLGGPRGVGLEPLGQVSRGGARLLHRHLGRGGIGDTFHAAAVTQSKHIRVVLQLQRVRRQDAAEFVLLHVQQLDQRTLLGAGGEDGQVGGVAVLGALLVDQGQRALAHTLHRGAQGHLDAVLTQRPHGGGAVVVCG
mmetsp:Transcript_22689/g.31096  ORF Transcript_22689/g.31096 Transcript_22689/m.31096 type:complete len:239 (-) Transcript_22689:876-1592(-)